MAIKIINNYFLNKNINRGGPLTCVVESKVLSGPKTFCTLLWKLRSPISMGGEIFWHIYYLIQNLLILHLNVENWGKFQKIVENFGKLF